MNISSILIACGRNCFVQGPRFNTQANFKGCDYEAQDSRGKGKDIPERAMKAHGQSRGTDPLILNLEH
jgi:hypothetical protein